MARSDGQVKRNKPALWEECMKIAEKKFGPFNARAMQYASKLYGEKGGGYSETKESTNSLTSWQKNKDKNKI